MNSPNHILYKGDCNEEMDKIPDGSIDMIFTDLPYATKTFGKCVDCKWDTPIDLPRMWEHFMRVKKLNAPIFFTCNVKLGFDLIRSAPKKCPFRYDIIWVKSAPTSFLSARKMPMRKHELIYVFYEKLPFYDLSSHTHKFKKTKPRTNDKNVYGMKACANGLEGAYTPKLPTTVQEEGKFMTVSKNTIFGDVNIEDFKGRNGGARWNPPLPVSVQIEESVEINKDAKKIGGKYDKSIYWLPEGKAGGKAWHDSQGGAKVYDPPLPVSVQIEKDEKIDSDTIYGELKINEYKKRKNGESAYNPPLPVSVQIEPYTEMEEHLLDKYKLQESKVIKNDTPEKTDIYGMNHKICQEKGFRNKKYEPPLPTSVYVPPKAREDVYNYTNRLNSGKLTRGDPKGVGKNGHYEWQPKLPVSHVEEEVLDECPVCNHYPTSILEISSKRGKHSTQKPTELIKWCLKYFSREGDMVLDCCMGSGSTGVACKEMNRKFVGIEMDDEIYKVAVDRVENE
tara:strand:- start:3152 stop:4672 length:1521 start_codon:yes stop_codon:yes gene_type:complete